MRVVLGISPGIWKAIVLMRGVSAGEPVISSGERGLSSVEEIERILLIGEAGIPLADRPLALDLSRNNCKNDDIRKQPEESVFGSAGFFFNIPI